MNSNLMALCSEKVKEALNEVSEGLCCVSAESKDAQLLDVQKTLSEIEDALASSEAATQPPGGTGMTWEGIVIGLRAVLADESEDYNERVWHCSRILDAIDLIEANDFGAAQPPNALPARVLAMCKKRGWDLSWSSRGVYLHLEASELTEALRGKHGDPLSEAADVLLVLMSITENAGIPWGDVLEQTAMTCARLEVCDPYPGEERGALTQPESEQIPPGPYSEQDLDAKAWAFINKQAKWGDPAAQSLVDLRELAPPVTQLAAPHVNGESEYTDQEWAEINRWGQSDVVAQPASPVLPAGGLVKSALHSFWKGMATSDEEATRAAIREVAAWLDLVGNKGSANDLRREVDR
jgi:hypothetical protein